MRTNLIRILLADNYSFRRAGIRTSLQTRQDFYLLGETSTIRETQGICKLLQPDILLMASNIAQPSLLQTLNAMEQSCPNMKILVIANELNDICSIRNLVSGGKGICKGVILKDENPTVLDLAIRNAIQGISSFSQKILNSLVSQSLDVSPIGPTKNLTKRETAVLKLLTGGNSNKEIGLRLRITQRTVEFHVSNILQKLGVSTRVEAAVWTTLQNVA